MALLPFSGPVIPVPVPISKGGTGSATQNFVDLSSTQTVGGNKIYTGNTVYNVASGTIADYQVGGSSKLTITSSTVTVVPQINTRNIAPSSNGNYTIGSTGFYYLNGYVTTTNYNSTASMTGASAGTINVNAGSLGILATSNAATHSLTLGSTATGIALYNTSDQTTNYERIVGAWSGNVFTLQAQNGGTGSLRQVSISSGSQTIQVSNGGTSGSGNAKVYFGGTSSGASAISVATGGTLSASSGVQYNLNVAPTINQSSTAGYTALLVNPTETTTGSGTKNLLDLQVGDTSKFRITNAGSLIFVSGMSMAGTDGSWTFPNAANFAFGTTTGTKIGTATSQKLSLWNKTPIVQPTTSIAAATFVANTSGTLNDTATFGGYTIGQIAAALINVGILA